MKEKMTIKEYMESQEYKIADIDFDIKKLDSDCIFIGDIYVVKYRFKYDYFDSFEDQIYLKLKSKNVILLRVGFEQYINLSNIQTMKQLEIVKKKLKNKATTTKNRGIILGSFFKPYAGEQIALNIKPYEKENKIQQETSKVKKYQKTLFK